MFFSSSSISSYYIALLKCNILTRHFDVLVYVLRRTVMANSILIEIEEGKYRTFGAMLMIYMLIQVIMNAVKRSTIYPPFYSYF